MHILCLIYKIFFITPTGDVYKRQMYKEVAEYTKEGNLWEFLGKNMTFGQKASLDVYKRQV